jgi:hypothetical protein
MYCIPEDSHLLLGMFKKVLWKILETKEAVAGKW